jgi:hypothetical protein
MSDQELGDCQRFEARAIRIGKDQANGQQEIRIWETPFPIVG